MGSGGNHRYTAATRPPGSCWCGRPSRDGKVTCVACAASRQRKHLKDYATTTPAERNARHHARKCRMHGITVEKYDALLQRQGGVCAVCKGECAHYARLSIDHNHECCPGTYSCGSCIRGLLCNNCNRAMGMFRDDAATLASAVKYLEAVNG